MHRCVHALYRVSVCVIRVRLMWYFNGLLWGNELLALDLRISCRTAVDYSRDTPERSQAAKKYGNK